MAKRDVAKINAEHLQDGDSIKDRLYNWVVTRYTEKGNEFGKSDKFVWKGTFYLVPTYVGYIIFISLFLWLANFSIERYGEARTYIFFMLLIIWRLQKIITKFDEVKKKLN